VKATENASGECQARDYSGVAFASEGVETTDEQAAAFAMQIKDKYKFSSDNADHYHTVKDWLLRYLSITRGLARNAEDEGKMNSDAKSTDPGLSAAERKTLRSREAGEAIAEHESAQAFHENRECHQTKQSNLWRQAG
jgi:hypothetical protein